MSSNSQNGVFHHRRIAKEKVTNHQSRLGDSAIIIQYGQCHQLPWREGKGERDIKREVERKREEERERRREGERERGREGEKLRRRKEERDRKRDGERERKREG